MSHDSYHRWTHHLRHAGRIFQQALNGLVLHLLFNRLDLGVGAVSGSDVLNQFIVERLVHGDEHTAHQQGGDQVLAA